MLLCITSMNMLAMRRIYIFYIGITNFSTCEPISAALAGIKIEHDADKDIASGALLVLAGHATNQDLPGNK